MRCLELFLRGRSCASMTREAHARGSFDQAGCQCNAAAHRTGLQKKVHVHVLHNVSFVKVGIFGPAYVSVFV